MPTYEFRCPSGHSFERFYRKIADAATELECPVCGQVAVRQLTGGAGLVFKGSGFYLTDYGRNAHRDGGDRKPGEKTAEASGESKSEAKTEAKSGESKPGAGSSAGDAAPKSSGSSETSSAKSDSSGSASSKKPGPSGGSNG